MSSISGLDALQIMLQNHKQDQGFQLQTHPKFDAEIQERLPQNDGILTE